MRMQGLGFRVQSSERRFRAVLSVLSAAFFVLPASADVSLNVTASRPRIYLGESFNLTVEVNGADQGVDAPDLSALQGADVQFLGQRSNSRSSISIINGRVTREKFEGRVFSYQIKPNAEGAFQAGPIQVTSSGKRISHPGVTVQVTGVEKQDTVVAAVTASSTSVLVEEPFTVTLSVAVAELPEPYAANNEPIHPNSPPQITADFLEIRQPVPGLKGPDLNQILNGLVDQGGRSPAFAINDYKSRDFAGFGSFFDDDPFRPRPIRFRLEPKRVTINGKKYRQYSLSLNYTPTKEGEFTFGPLTFKGKVIADVSANRQAVMKDVYTIGPAVTVRVIPPPDAGRPDNFIGSVGKSLQASASFDATVCKVGDPLTLTLELTGSISTSNMRTPILSLQPDLVKDFRIYDDNATADTLPNGKRFTYRVRPTREGTLEFPPIRLSFYNTDTRTYDTVSTAPIPIQAHATTQIATEGGDSDAAAGTLRADERPLPAGITLARQGTATNSLLPTPRLTAILAVAGPLLCLAALLLAPLSRLVRRTRDHRRHSGALRRALAALRRVQTPEHAAQAVRGYFAERLDVAGQALTPTDVPPLLTDKGLAPETAATCGRLLAQLDELLYRPDAADTLPEVVRALRNTLPAVDAALGKPPRAQSADGALLLILLAVSPALLAQADDTVRGFLWEQANTQAAAARSSDDYAKAAKTYNRLVAEGARNGPLFLNLGCTLVMAGDGANAAAAFERAERYQGVSPESRQGLAAAQALKTGRSRAELPWYRTAFFWHYALPCPMRALAALGGWSLFWFGLLCRIFDRRRGSRTFLRAMSGTSLLTGGVFALVFAASVLLTLAHERHDEVTWSARAPATVAAPEQGGTP